MNKYFVLSFVAGVLCKLYDDLYDLNLYETLGISKKNKLYLNEFLKSSFALSSTAISINYPFFFLAFYIVNIIFYFVKTDEYLIYETSGLIAMSILIPFLNWTKNKITLNDIYLFLLWLIFAVFVELLCNKQNNTEYSYPKLFIRFCGSLSVIFFIFINQKFNFFSESVIVVLFLLLGYLITSSIFQFTLLNKIIKPSSPKLKKQKKKKKEKKKENKENKRENEK